MKFVKTDGLVLREISTGDADKIVIVLTPDHGKITLSAVGAKRPRSKFVGCTEFLCYSKLDLFKSSDNYRLNEGRIIQPFYEIRNDVTKLAIAAYFCEVMVDCVQEEHSAKREMRLILNALHFIASEKKEPELICSIFELRLLSILGMAPSLEACHICKKVPEPEYYFSFSECAFYCRDCLPHPGNKAMKVTKGTFYAVFHIINAKMDKLFNFELSKEVLQELTLLSRRYFKERMEKNYKTMDFLSKIDQFKMK